MAALNAFARAFWDMPPVTRMYMAASVATTMAVQLEIISPFQLYFNPKLILKSHQYWRLITTFLFFGPLGFNFLFNLVFTYRYCRMLEEEFFRNRTADFFYMFLIGGTIMSMLAYFVNMLFLGHAFTIMLVYIWSRRNPSVRMNFFGLITFHAPYLPWVLLAFSILLGSSTVVDIIGIIVGHFYYFFEDVFPNEPHGFRILTTPRFIKNFFNWLGVDEPPLPEEPERPEQNDFADRAAEQQADSQAQETSTTPSSVRPSDGQAETIHNNNEAAATNNELNEEQSMRARNVGASGTGTGG